MLATVVDDFVDRRGPLRESGVAAIFLGDLASREVHPGAPMELLFVHDGGEAGECERLCQRFRDALAGLAENSLLFSPFSRQSDGCPAVPLSSLVDDGGELGAGGLPDLTRARCAFESGDADVGARFAEARLAILANTTAQDALIASLRQPTSNRAEADPSSFKHMRGGLLDIERTARLVQLTQGQLAPQDTAPTAAAVLQEREPLAQAAALWRDLQGVTRLIGEEGFDTAAAGPKVKALVANACGHEDFDALSSAVAETASRAATEMDALVSPV